MAKVISYANQKGGVGKSTLCIQTAFYLSLKRKKKVLVKKKFEFLIEVRDLDLCI